VGHSGLVSAHVKDALGEHVAHFVPTEVTAPHALKACGVCVRFGLAEGSERDEAPHHVPAPPPSQIVHVTMTQGRALKAEFGPLILRGRLRLEEAKGFYGSATYSMLGLSSEPYFK
jgi:hypothetical protein